MTTNFSKAGKLSLRGLLIPTIAMAICSTAGATSYSGNGATGFGGSVGTGSVSITDSLAGMNITFNRGSGTMDNDLVLYLDTQSGGFGDTSLFSDNGDPGRTAISGYNGGNPSRTIASFASGFAADYAISIENGFIGVFGLASGGNGSLNYLFGQSQSGNNSDASYTISLTPIQMSQIGLTAGSGQTLFLEGTLSSGSAYRSNETIGSSITSPDGGSAPNAGFNGSVAFTSADAYTLTAVPEPSTLALMGMGAISSMLFYRRRK
ncbi:MAG TPA: PEP-CTERM sorting domain-containing protein [Verrucomicrobiae bacterium]|nr:PEP-CTERM sorting domain-containing protein [Verrucomicrobiae bacterium]